MNGRINNWKDLERSKLGQVDVLSITEKTHENPKNSTEILDFWTFSIVQLLRLALFNGPN
jgi:hypothetical protein